MRFINLELKFPEEVSVVAPPGFSAYAALLLSGKAQLHISRDDPPHGSYVARTAVGSVTGVMTVDTSRTFEDDDNVHGSSLAPSPTLSTENSVYEQGDGGLLSGLNDKMAGKEPRPRDIFCWW
jgi:hypothetical protein